MTGPTAAAPRRRPLALYAVAAGAFVAAALGAAYFDWINWVVEHGGFIELILAAAALLLVGCIAAVLGRWSGRAWLKRVALVVLAMGVGVVAGQVLGPSREPDFRAEGTVTLRLESPVVATATGTAFCWNVASATEFAVSGDGDMLLDAGDRPAVYVSADVGSRWEALRDGPRKDGVLLRIDLTGRLISDAGKPGTLSMRADGSSTLTSTFSNSGGTIRFAGLVAQPTGTDFNGDSLDLAGTLEWTCGPAPAATP